MNKTLIWDLPTRLFHWAFAASLIATFVFGENEGEGNEPGGSEHRGGRNDHEAEEDDD